MFTRRTFCLLIFLNLVNFVHVLPYKNVTCVDGRMVSPTHKSHRYYECCPGYRQENTLDIIDSSIKCVPICMPACQNAACVAPQTCKCNTGYTGDRNDSQKCLPYCSDGCNHGTCTAPEVCLCDHGYIYDLVEEACRPVCTEPCINGTCISPENCQCNPGYRKSEKNTCEPYCSVGCDHGYCIAPETCSCITGYSNMNELGTCKPICSSCLNGQCLAPDTCVCYSGFYLYDSACIRMNVSSSTTDETTTAEVTTTDASTIELTSSFEEAYAYDMTTHVPILGYDAALEGKDSSEKASVLAVPVIGSLLLVVSVLSMGILITNWSKIYDFFIGQTYTVE